MKCSYQATTLFTYGATSDNLDHWLVDAEGAECSIAADAEKIRKFIMQLPGGFRKLSSTITRARAMKGIQAQNLQMSSGLSTEEYPKRDSRFVDEQLEAKGFTGDAD